MLNYSAKLIFFIYILFKSLIVLTLIAILPSVFGQGYFNYDDFSSSYSSCNINSPNGFFSLLICTIDVESIANTKAIAIAFIINSFRDLFMISILIKQKILGQKSLFIFVVLLSLHPYLALYHAKLTTSMFAALGIVLMYYVLISFKRHSALIDLFFIVLTGFRNALAGIVAPFYIWEIVRQSMGIVKGREHFDWYYIKNTLSLVAVLLILSLSGEYIFAFITGANSYSLTLAFFTQYIDTSFALVDNFIGVVLVILSHLFFLFGFREAAYTQFPEFFMAWDQMTYFHIFMGIILAIAHALGFFYFMKSHLSLDRRFIIFVIILLPTIFSVAHLRYFMPFMPFAMLGLSMLMDRRIS